MTTVDVVITCEGAGDWRLEAHNGLFGPATDLLYEVGKLVESGDASGSYDGASISATCRGSALVPILTPLGRVQVNGEPLSGEQAALALVESDLYSVWGVEF